MYVLYTFFHACTNLHQIYHTHNLPSGDKHCEGHISPPYLCLLNCHPPSPTLTGKSPSHWQVTKSIPFSPSPLLSFPPLPFASLPSPPYHSLLHPSPPLTFPLLPSPLLVSPLLPSPLPSFPSSPLSFPLPSSPLLSFPPPPPPFSILPLSSNVSMRSHSSSSGRGDKIKQLAVWRAETETIYKNNRHSKKLKQLENYKNQTTTPQLHLQQVVHNISHRRLTTAETNVLAKGFNFAVAPNKIPTETIICGVETSLTKLNVDEADQVRHEVTNILRTSKPPKSNLTKEEQVALQNLRKDNSIIILPADKGNATVVMNTTDYEEKLSNLLKETTYKPINTDPTTYLEKTTRQKIKSTSISKETQQTIIPREKSSRCPKLYGLPKIHKDGIPLRPIVSSIGSPLQNLAKYLAKHLQPHAESAASYVQNSYHFIELVKNLQIDQKDLLVSFDVVSLFTQVPVREALSTIRSKYQPPNHIIELAEHCLSNTYFIHRGQRYKQIEGAPMGSPLSPVIANLFMEEFETNALEKTAYKPKLWLRYVDDTFVIWSHGRKELENFLTHLNSLHPKIKFTMEIEADNQLPFLDVLIYKKPNGTLGHTVYQKKTHTNRYLNAQSHHHPAQINSVAKTLITRTRRLADETHIQTELHTLTDVLIANNFPKNKITNMIQQKTQKQQKTQEEEQNNGRAILPYIKGTTDKISKVLRRHNIKTAFNTDRKISTILRNPKDKIELENQGIYEVPCASCPATYIGQTNRRIEVRVEEHKNSVQKKQQTSSLVQHINTTGHNINFEGTKTIAKMEHLNGRIIREAIEIEKRPHSMNKRDDTSRLPAIWKPALIEKRISAKKKLRNQQTTPNATTPNRTNPHTQQELTHTENRTRPWTRSQAKVPSPEQNTEPPNNSKTRRPQAKATPSTPQGVTTTSPQEIQQTCLHTLTTPAAQNVVAQIINEPIQKAPSTETTITTQLIRLHSSNPPSNQDTATKPASYTHPPAYIERRQLRSRSVLTQERETARR